MPVVASLVADHRHPPLSKSPRLTCLSLDIPVQLLSPVGIRGVTRTINCRPKGVVRGRRDVRPAIPVLKPKASARQKELLEFRLAQAGSDKATGLVNEELMEEAVEGAVVVVRPLKVGLSEDNAIGIRRDAWLDQSVKMKQPSMSNLLYRRVRVNIRGATFPA